MLVNVSTVERWDTRETTELNILKVFIKLSYHLVLLMIIKLIVQVKTRRKGM